MSIYTHQMFTGCPLFTYVCVSAARKYNTGTLASPSLVPVSMQFKHTIALQILMGKLALGGQLLCFHAHHKHQRSFFSRLNCRSAEKTYRHSSAKIRTTVRNTGKPRIPFIADPMLSWRGLPNFVAISVEIRWESSILTHGLQHIFRNSVLHRTISHTILVKLV